MLEREIGAQHQQLERAEEEKRREQARLERRAVAQEEELRQHQSEVERREAKAMAQKEAIVRRILHGKERAFLGMCVSAWRRLCSTGTGMGWQIEKVQLE